MELLEIETQKILQNLFRLSVAYALAIPIGLNRERDSRSAAGMRTFPLVAMTSCGYMLLGLSHFSEQEAVARVLYGLITGMGFIGGGAILKNDSGVAGTATATSLWCTGAIGVSVAMERYEIALPLSAMTFFTFVLKHRFLKGQPDRES